MVVVVDGGGVLPFCDEFDLRVKFLFTGGDTGGFSSV